ncbi:MAG: hypothetical protein EOM21_17200 [Gammaproteobacteria bacterium]|nr:hypothetical protein [Gammaproteobacteria bacterium]
MGIRVDGVQQVRELLTKLAQESPKAAVAAQNKMVYQLKQGMDLQMVADIDRPKPYSRSAVRYTKAELGKMRARLYVQSEDGSAADEQHYLGVQVLGGRRKRLRHSERVLQSRGLMPQGYVWVPTRFTRLDTYGNVPAAMISAILGSGRYTGGTDKYIVVGDPGRERGVWYQFPDGRFLPVLLFLSPREYRERFDFYGRADREIQAHLLAYLEKALDEAIVAAAS